MSGRLRTAALLGCGALAVHQLRYLLAHGDDASQALAREGHSYLGMLAPLVALIAGVALLDFLLTVIRRRTGTAAAPMRWIAATTTLLAIYAGQESLEGLLSPGHPAGLAGLVGNGGWVAVPLAIAAGLVIALLLRGAERVIAERARHRPSLVSPTGATAYRVVGVIVFAPRRSPLAFKLAGRAPPALS